MASIKNLGIAAAVGTAAYALLKKPDGTQVSTGALSSTISKGLAKPITGLLGPGAIDPIKDGISKVLGEANKVAKSGRAGLKNIVPNPMELFASYTFAWTLACLEPKQFNNPPSYRKSTGDLKHIVFASAGRFDSQRTQTAYGAPEYYINNFQMNSTIAATQATGNTNAVKFTFDIIEPHSMGLLLQSLQNAALNAGYANYLSNAPFVLRLDFLGYDETGKIYTSIKPKFYTVALVKVAFTVNENGSVYKCEAVPYNHKGFSDVVNTAYTDVKLTCSPTGTDAGTVKDLLVSGEGSLCAFLNANEEKLVKEGQIGIPDVYEIQFPEKSSDFISQTSNAKVTSKASADPKASATTVISGTNIAVSTDFGSNTIGASDFGFDQKSGGNVPFKKHGDTVDEKTGVVKRDDMTIDPKTRAFQFGQSQNLTAIINQIILSSTYSKQALDPKNMTPEGMIKWWRLDTQIQLLDYDPLIGDFAKKVIYRVVPFLVHHSVFTPPNATPVGYEELKGQIVKEYNYIYTGQNVDVLKFDIEINNLFYTGMNPSPASESAKVSNQDQKGVGEDLPATTKTSNGSSPAAQLANLGRSRLKRSPALLNKSKGGSGDKTSEQVVAENFHNAMVSSGSGDLINVNLEVLGDPYWMVDSGMANYFSPASSQSRLITEDGTVNYESGDVMIYLTFRTPADINEATGLYEFATKGKESPFSGIYRVLGCENSFNDGIFKQKLKCVRMVGQSQDYTGNNPNELSKLVIDKLSSIATVLGRDERPKSTLTDDPSGDGSGRRIMPEEIRSPLDSNESSSELGTGSYLARIVSHLDPTIMGSLEVTLLRDQGNVIGSNTQTYVVRCAMPFFGYTNYEFMGQNTAAGTGTTLDAYNDTQKSYGMWFVPPDIGVNVLVTFVDGDPAEGYWFACVPGRYANNMVPAIAGSTAVDMDAADKKKYDTKQPLPVAEINKRLNSKDSLVNVDKIKKPLHPIAEAFLRQGLVEDDVRGVTTSSARREIPSMVFGISTPGPLDKRTNAKKSFVGKLNDQTKRPVAVSRLGGSTFVMDDGDDRYLRATPAGEGPVKYIDTLEAKPGEKGNVDIPYNEYIRLRTRTGHQILMHNSEDLIYIGNAKGSSWIEMTSNGKIDIYAADSVSIHTEVDLNIRADRDINLEAGRNINMKAETGRWHVEAFTDLEFLINNDAKITVGKDHNLLVGADNKISTKGNFGLATNGDNNFSATGNTNIGSGGDHIETAGVIHMNDTTAAAPAEVADFVKPLELHENPATSTSVGWAGKKYQAGTFTSIMKRIPMHEPWLLHENQAPQQLTPADTDRET